MKFLITGGAGFMGSHLADALINSGHQVHVFDNLSTGNLENIQHLIGNRNFEITIESILNYHVLEQHVSNCDMVFHLAAAVGVKLIMEKPVETIVTNVHGTENVLKLCNIYNRKVLIASTSEVYGKMMNYTSNSSLNENNDWTLGPTTVRRWAYACSKALDEFSALAYFDEKKLPVVVVRFFNVAGPRQTGQYGMVIPKFVRSALLNEPLLVYGDGTQTRNFTYVLDAVETITKLMHIAESEGQIINVGSEDEISINELAQRILSNTKSKSVITHIPYDQVYSKGFEDMERRVPDLSKIKSLIDYRPRHDIDNIIENVTRYYKLKLNI